jgi:hypothetical protein
MGDTALIVAPQIVDIPDSAVLFYQYRRCGISIAAKII